MLSLLVLDLSGANDAPLNHWLMAMGSVLDMAQVVRDVQIVNYSTGKMIFSDDYWMISLDFEC